MSEGEVDIERRRQTVRRVSVRGSVPLHASRDPAQQSRTRPTCMPSQRALDALDLEADLGDAIVVELPCNQRDGTEANAIADFHRVLVMEREMLAESQARIARAHR